MCCCSRYSPSIDSKRYFGRHHDTRLYNVSPAIQTVVSPTPPPKKKQKVYCRGLSRTRSSSFVLTCSHACIFPHRFNQCSSADPAMRWRRPRLGIAAFETAEPNSTRHSRLARFTSLLTSFVRKHCVLLPSPLPSISPRSRLGAPCPEQMAPATSISPLGHEEGVGITSFEHQCNAVYFAYISTMRRTVIFKTPPTQTKTVAVQETHP